MSTPSYCFLVKVGTKQICTENLHGQRKKQKMELCSSGDSTLKNWEYLILCLFSVLSNHKKAVKH